MKRLILTAITVLFSALAFGVQNGAATAPAPAQLQPAAKHVRHHHSRHHTHRHHAHHTGA